MTSTSLCRRTCLLGLKGPATALPHSCYNLQIAVRYGLPVSKACTSGATHCTTQLGNKGAQMGMLMLSWLPGLTSTTSDWQLRRTSGRLPRLLTRRAQRSLDFAWTPPLAYSKAWSQLSAQSGSLPHERRIAWLQRQQGEGHRGSACGPCPGGSACRGSCGPSGPSAQQTPPPLCCAALHCMATLGRLHGRSRYSLHCFSLQAPQMIVAASCVMSLLSVSGPQHACISGRNFRT